MSWPASQPLRLGRSWVVLVARALRGQWRGATTRPSCCSCSSTRQPRMLRLATAPRWQRTYGTFGESPELITDIVGRLVAGMQGDELGPDSLAATIKHFRRRAA